MVVDASALVAVLLREPEGMVFRHAMASATTLHLSPIGYWEASTRLRSLRGESGVADLDRLMASLSIEIAPAGPATASLAANAERDYGKRTPPRLNLGDCFAYALAKERGLPLLYKGEHFARTDVESALAV